MTPSTSKASTEAERKARARASRAKWNARNPEKARALSAAWKERNQERVRAYRGLWRQRNPGKVRAYRDIWRARHGVGEAVRVCLAYPYVREGGRCDDLTLQIWAAIPRSIHPGIKADLCQDVLIALLERKGSAADIPQLVKSCARSARRLMSDPRKFYSLDDVIPGTAIRRVDTIPSDAMHF